MKYKVLLDFFRRIESEYPVQEWTLEDLHIWPLVRLRMGSEFTNKYVLKADNCLVRSKGAYIWKICNSINVIYRMLRDDWKLSYRDYCHQQKLIPCDIVMLGDADDRNIQMPSGELMDHILDPLYETLQKEGYCVFKFEEIGKGGPRYPRYSPSFAINNMILKALIKRKLNRRTAKKINVDTKKYQEIMRIFSQLFPKINPIPFDTILSDYMYISFLEEAFFEKLKVISPCLVILECWYSLAKMALCLAAYKFGIPVVEIQHGMAKRDGHDAYYDWTKMPSTGYEIMPDYMWTWNQETYDGIARWGADKVIPIWGGYPIDLIWCNPESTFVRCYYEKYKGLVGNSRSAILFSLQWGISYPDWIVDFINESEEYTWLIRLHPNVDDKEREFLGKLENKVNIVWQGIQTFPLDILLQNVFLHITSYSGVVIEADRFNCPSIVLHPLAQELYEPQIHRGMVCYIETRDDLSMAIEDTLRKRKKKMDFERMRKMFYARGRHGIEKLIKIMEDNKV